MRGLIAQQWDSYRHEVIPADAPEVQNVECRRAFYAGAWAYHCILMERMGSGGPATADEMDIMRSLEAELRAFRNSVQAGVA